MVETAKYLGTNNNSSSNLKLQEKPEIGLETIQALLEDCEL
jgi:hypothetical protein